MNKLTLTALAIIISVSSVKAADFQRQLLLSQISDSQASDPKPAKVAALFDYQTALKLWTESTNASLSDLAGWHAGALVSSDKAGSLYGSLIQIKNLVGPSGSQSPFIYETYSDNLNEFNDLNASAAKFKAFAAAYTGNFLGKSYMSFPIAKAENLGNLDITYKMSGTALMVRYAYSNGPTLFGFYDKH